MEKVYFNEELEKIGLSEKEAAIYSALLETGGAYPSAISSLTNLNRSTVYKILTSLSIKGVVNEIEKGKKLFYQIEKPERLLRYTRQRAEFAQESLKTAEMLLPLLEGTYSKAPHKPKVRFFQNVEGVMSILDEHITTGSKYEMLGWANTVGLEEFIPKKYFRHYIKEKERQGITTRGISPNTEQDKSFNNRMYSGVKKNIIPAFKHVPLDEFPFNGEIVVYGTNKVSFFNFEHKDKPIGIVIEDVWIHKMMRMIFEQAWKSAK